ncbi:AAA family ATPase [Amycolatopsis mongoliensis]|uniref:AAA family ATPase n=1 Tax=Amycolatopsis mongoliensis TaxID=715475 RepID=A0A9Y2JQW1_9PSEU|nr:LuxR family transcriptional regulator [Amycolatopsis sp. 4-36]WIY01884.1 AAA family ATPase [Amycolatopsis sp. 4-36]
MGSPGSDDAPVLDGWTRPGETGLPHQRGVPGPRLAERDEESALLTGLVHGLADGNPAVVTVTGAPGSGRSALLASVAATARHARLRVAHVPCCPSDGTEPFTVLHQIFTALGGGLPAAAVGESTGPVPDGRVLGGLCRDLAAAVEGRPLVLAVDDLHWADAASRAWLHALSGLLGDIPVLLVVSQTSGLDTWRPVAAAHGIRLRPLGDAAVARLVRERLGAAADERLVEHAVRGSGGNPAVLTEALNRLRMEPGFARERAGLFTRIAGERLLRLVDVLPAELTAVLRAVSVCQEGFGPALLAELAGCPPERLAADLARLREIGLVAPGGGLAEPDAGQRVLGRMSEGERDAFFTRAAKLGHEHGVANAAVAAILRRTRVIGEPWVVEVLRAAARLGQAGDRDGQATASLKRALQEPLDPARRAAVLIDLGAAELLLDQDAGDRHLARVLSELDGPGLGGHRLLAADLLNARGGLNVRTLVAAFRRPDVSAAERETLLALYWLVDGDPQDRSAVGGYGMPPLPERPADPAQAAAAAVLLARRGLRPARVRGLARAALAQPMAEVGALTVRAAAVGALVLTGDLAEADTHGEDVLAQARRQCSRTLVARALAERAERHLAAGTLDDAAADLSGAHELVPPRHWHSMLRARVVATEARVHLEAGRVDLARQALERDPVEPGPGLGSAFLLYAKGAVLLGEDRPEQALAPLRECGRRLSARGWENPEVLPWRSTAAKCLVAGGEREAARLLLGEELAAATAWGTRAAVGGAHLAAGLALGPRDPDRAGHLAQAVGLLRGSGSHLRHATALVELAAGDGDGAGDLLAEARTLAARYRWRGVLGRLNELTGGEVSRLHGLSEAQRRVAKLAAAGTSNAGIAVELAVTRRTVELHLTNVYRKLGIGGRRQLAEALASAGEEG